MSWELSDKTLEWKTHTRWEGPTFPSGQVLWEARTSWHWGFAGPCLDWELCTEHGILRDGKDPEDAPAQPWGSSAVWPWALQGQGEESSTERRKGALFPVSQSTEELGRNSFKWSSQNFYQALKESVKLFRNSVHSKKPWESSKVPFASSPSL